MQNRQGTTKDMTGLHLTLDAFQHPNRIQNTYMKALQSSGGHTNMSLDMA